MLVLHRLAEPAFDDGHPTGSRTALHPTPLADRGHLRGSLFEFPWFSHLLSSLFIREIKSKTTVGANQFGAAPRQRFRRREHG
jgi:hypothetical protein